MMETPRSTPAARSKLVIEERMNIGELKVFVESNCDTGTDRDNSNLISPTGLLHGTILLNCREVLIRGIWIKLTITTVMSKGGNKDQAIDHLVEHPEYQCGGLYDVVLGRCIDLCDSSEVGGRGRKSAFLEIEGEKSFSFGFCLGNSSMTPLSYIDERVETLYSLTCVIDTVAFPRAATSALCYFVNTRPSFMEERADKSMCTGTSVGVYGSSDRIGGMGFLYSSLLCGGFKIRPEIEITTTRRQGFHINIGTQANFQDHTIPLCCEIPSQLLLSKKGHFSGSYRIILSVIYKRSYYNIQAGSAKKIRQNRLHVIETVLYRNEQPVAIGSRYQRQMGNVNVQFTAPLTVDSTELHAALRSWPRPMVESVSKRSPMAILSYSTSTALYSIQTIIKAELVKLNNWRGPKIISSVIKEIDVSPVIRLTTSASSNDRSVATNRTALFDVTNTIATMNITGKPPLHNAKAALKQSLSSSSSLATKILTPIAKIAIPRVRAELVSKGSAAIVMDRSRETEEEQAIGLSPRWFAQMHQLANSNDVTVLQTPLTERRELRSTMDCYSGNVTALRDETPMMALAVRRISNNSNTNGSASSAIVPLGSARVGEDYNQNDNNCDSNFEGYPQQPVLSRSVLFFEDFE